MVTEAFLVYLDVSDLQGSNDAPLRSLLMSSCLLRSEGFRTSKLSSPELLLHTDGNKMSTAWECQHILQPVQFWEMSTDQITIFKNTI